MNICLRYVGLRSSRYKSTNPHYQDPSVSYAQSDSEEDDVDKYSVGTPTFSQTGPRLGSRERLHPLCPQCGREYHYDKVLRDQCRLMTALLEV